MSGVSLTMLALRMADLSELAGWPPVGTLAESVKDAAAGSEGLTRHEVDRIIRWSSRWPLLRDEIREFYIRNAPSDPAAWHALRCLLDGGPRPAGAVYGRLAELWLTDHGYDPPFTLCPMTLTRSPGTAHPDNTRGGHLEE